MTGVQLSPADTCFFGDGVPFSDFGPQEDVVGVFPPHPPTMVGAIRAVLAQAQGWSGTGRWDRRLNEVLGDGPQLASLEVTGPILLRGGEPLFPAPRHLLGVTNEGDDQAPYKRWSPRALLRPGEALCCDMGEAVRLPQLFSSCSPEDERQLKPGSWITQAGLREVLEWRVPGPSNTARNDDLWTEEKRIGLARDPITRTAKEGALYSARHVRLQPSVTVGAQVRGIPKSWSWPWGTMIPFGGESRLSALIEWKQPFVVPHALGELERHGRLMVIALTPLDLGLAHGGELGFPAECGAVTLVSACIDRAQRTGGWDTLNNRPHPLGSVLPAGSVLFCKSREPQKLRQALDNISSPGAKLGARQAWGFGLVALGTWPESLETNA